MGWEKRGAKRYYYQKRRIGRRVVSEYMPCAMLAGMLQEMHDEWRIGEQLLGGVERAHREREMKIEARLDEAESRLRTILDASLLGAGFHEHRGQWRRRRP